MATKVTVLGPNSSVVSFSQGSTLDEVISAVNDEIVNNHGWTLHDGNAGDPKIKCYKASNKDTQSFKYMQLDWSVDGKLRFGGYGTWDEVAHTGTLVAKRTDGLFDAEVKLTDRGNVYLFISPRWFAFCIKQFSAATIFSSTQASIGGIFEIVRDNPDDTVSAGYPPFCALTTGVAGAHPTATIPTLLLPKSLSGSDNQPGEFSTIFGKTRQGVRLESLAPNVANPFSEKDWAITPYVHGPNNEIRGRIFGLKIFTKNKLHFMDKVSVTCNTDFMYDISGPATDHYVVPGGFNGADKYNMRYLIPT